MGGGHIFSGHIDVGCAAPMMVGMLAFAMSFEFLTNVMEEKHRMGSTAERGKEKALTLERLCLRTPASCAPALRCLCAGRALQDSSRG